MSGAGRRPGGGNSDNRGTEADDTFTFTFTR
jgi:hypothetical protein